MKIRQFIQENFLIDNATSGAYVPFTFNAVQNKYYDLLCRDYGEELNFEGAREIVLKARKEGFTSLILAIFTALMILSKNPSRYLEISYKDDATKQHYRRARNFVLSFYEKDPLKWSKKLAKSIFKSDNEGAEFVLDHNGASFYVGTASARTGERGGTVQGALFSEAAHFPDTGIISAREIIEGTKSMVAVNSGLVFQESTANGTNHYKTTWEMANRKEVDYKPRFFGWRDFYTVEEFKKISDGFTDKTLIPQEFPDNPQEAFRTSGFCVFDKHGMELQEKAIDTPKWVGYLKDHGDSVSIMQDDKGQLKIFSEPRTGIEYLIGADVAEGVKGGDYSSAHVIDRETWEVVAHWHGHRNPADFGEILNTLGFYYNNAQIAVEVNNHGIGTIQKLNDLKYKNLYMHDKNAFGWKTDMKSRSSLITNMQETVKDGLVKVKDRATLDEMYNFARNEKSGKIEALAGSHDDCVMSLGIALHAAHYRNDFSSFKSHNNRPHKAYIPPRYRTAAA